MTIGEKIRVLRKNKGLTQKKLGELSGTSETTIKQYESGKRTPQLEQLVKIADTFLVPVDFFTTDWESALKKENWKTTEEERRIIAQEHDLLRHYRSLNTEGRKEARKRVQELTEIFRYMKPDAPELNAAHADNYADAPEELKEREEKMMDDEDF